MTKGLDNIIRGRRVVVVGEIGGRSRRVVCNADRKTVVGNFFVVQFSETV